MNSKPRSFDRYWEVCGMPRSARLDHSITWNSAVDEACAALSQRLPYATLDELRDLTKDVRAKLGG